MFSKSLLFDFFLVLTLASVVFLVGIRQGDVGLWEPWETSTLLASQQVAQSSIVESSFWVPRVEGTFVAQPCMQLWSVAALLSLYPEPDAFLLRLPGAILGIFLVLLAFLTVRQISTRRTAWMCVGILLTMPMFVLSGKFIHGDIWLAFAVGVPNLLYMLACYASTRRMHRVMLSLSALSAVTSFLSGGFFAFAVLFVEGLIAAILLRNNPHKDDIIKPLTTRYFLVPLYIAFVISGSIFGIHVTQSRYELENRTPMILADINKALDEDRVISIERRGDQIIGTIRPSGIHDGRTQAFILVESAEDLNTNAPAIFSLYETEQRTFENYLQWRFKQKEPSPATMEIPPIHGAFLTALRFFWYHTNEPIRHAALPLARVNRDAIEANPEYAFMYQESAIAGIEGDDGDSVPIQGDDLLRVLNIPVGYDWIEVQNGDGRQGYVHKSALTISHESDIRWTSWLDILLYGLFPWSCFFPIVFVCALITPKHLAIASSPFRGEFYFESADENKVRRAPIQMLLLAWILTALVAFFFGINQSRHDFFSAAIPVAILLSLSLTAPRFWRALRESLEARLALILTAFVCIGIAFFALPREPFRLVRYMMTDPPMHWDSENASVFHDNFRVIVGYVVCFVILTIVALGGASERIQNRITAWREKWNEKHRSNASDARASTSYSSLIRISRGETEPIPYAPTISLIILGFLSAAFIYYSYIPSISNDFTEKELIDRYFELAKASEPIYLVSGESTPLCQTYRDCAPGYVCHSSHCRLSTFASYSLSVAHTISSAEMLHNLDPVFPGRPAFYVIPRDTLFSINESYRAYFDADQRRNLKVIDAPSSRLYLIGDQESEIDINPMNEILVSRVPEDAEPFAKPLSDGIFLEAFRIDDAKHWPSIDLTVFFRVVRVPEHDEKFSFTFSVGSRNVTLERPLLPRNLPALKLLEGDLVASPMHFELTAMPAHGTVDIGVGIVDGKNVAESVSLTTVGY